MKLYTTTQEISYNALISAITTTWESVQVFSFEDCQGLVLDQLFYLRTDKRDEDTGLWIWEAVVVQDIIIGGSSKVYVLENGQFVLEDTHGKYGLFECYPLEQYTFKIYSHFLTTLYNQDLSGLDEQDMIEYEEIVNELLELFPSGYVIVDTFNEDTDFCIPDIGGHLAGDCATVIFRSS